MISLRREVLATDISAFSACCLANQELDPNEQEPEANKRVVFKCIQLQVTLLPRASTAPAQLLAALRYDAKGLKRALFCSAWTPAFRSLRRSRSK